MGAAGVGSSKAGASKYSIACSLPESKRWKSSLRRLGTGLPCASRTATRTTTRLLLTLSRVVGRLLAGSCALAVGAISARATTILGFSMDAPSAGRSLAFRQCLHRGYGHDTDFV